MLLKLRKILIIIFIVVAIVYVLFLVFYKPNGFTDKEGLVNSYFKNITNESVCDDHFNPETADFCEYFQFSSQDKTIEIMSLTADGDNYLVVILLNTREVELVVSFIEIEVAGLKSFLNKTYYLIDLIT